jgi:DNA ligase (NAD+)
VGIQTAMVLARKFTTLDNLIAATRDELLEISDIGEVVAESILAYFNDEENNRLIVDTTYYN